uniref:Sister chromatid cohesion protein n=1 Tax=Pinguiococcus pyrenoidosus TaxID=172671 RepID=A0A7R9UFA3_9STRA
MASAAPEPSSPKLPGPVIDAVMRTIRILRSSADEEKRLSQVSPTAKVRETPLKGHALLRQALALYLVEEGLPEHSRKFRLAEWMHNWSSLSDTDYDAPEVYLAQWDVPEHVQHACFPALPRHVLDQLGRGCLLDGGLIGAKEKLQTRLLDLLRAPLVGVRSRALKALSVVIEKDPSLMLQPAIAHAVESSLSDEAISVRQAVVDLVGKYSLGSMECFDVYRTSLLDRIIDKGVSVRKSVVKILQGVLLKFPAYPKRVLLCTALVKSLNMRREEDSVKELVSSIFAKIWFDNAIEGGADVPELVQDEKSSENGQSGETGENGQNGQNGEEASQPSLDSATKVRRRKRSSSGASLSRKRDQANARHLKHIAEQIVEVVAMQNCEPVWLVGLVGELLNGPGEGDEGKKDVRERARRVKTRCEELTSHLMELVASVESGGEALDALKEISPAQQLLAVLETLCVLSNAAPSSLIPHLASFWPYLKADNGFDAHTEGRLCELICNMVCSALLHAGNDVLGLDEGTLADVNSDLRALALRFGTATVTASVHAMCVIAIYTQKPTALVRIGSPFHAKISAILQGPVDKPYQPREAQFVERGLVILGALVRFWHGHVRRAKGGSLEGLDTAALSTKQSAWLEKLPTLLANALPKLLRRCSPHGHRNRGVRLRIVSALTALFIGNPAEVLRLHNDGLLQGLLRDEDLEIVTSSVRLLREALDEEESRVESGIARQQMTVKTESGTMQVAHQVRGDQDSEASICGGIAAMLMSEIRSHLYGQDVQLRYESLCLQGTLLRQGLQNPNDCIKSLVVLQADQCVPVRSEALRQLLLEYEKHPSFLLVHFVGGVAKSMGFQQTVFGELCAIRSDSSEENGGVESVFGRVYSMCIRGSRKHRQSTLTKLLKLVVAPAERCERRSAQVVANAADPSAEAEPPSFQRFLAEVLAYLPYVQHDEVLFVLYSTSHLISQYAHHVLEGAVDQLQKVGLAGDSIEEMTAPSDDMPAADLPAASLHAFQKLVRGATCMKLLVGLFKFLKGYYGVTHGRLEKYHPSQSVRKYQTGVSRADTSSSFREVLRTLLPNGSVDEAEELMRAFSVPLFMTYLQGLQDLLDREATTIVDEDVEVMDTPKSNASPSRPKRARRTQRVTVEVESDGYFSCADDEDCEADEEDDEQDSASVV